MGVNLFKDNNWERIEAGAVSAGDLLGLDPEKDRLLISRLLFHMDEQKRERVMRKLHMDILPEMPVNTDDPEDELYSAYYVLKEQVMRECDAEVLKNAVFFYGRNATGRFAFCRLTGYSWPPDENDAYSYRTFSCGLKRNQTREGSADLCRKMIEQKGPFADEAEEWLSRLPEISDERLSEWASDDTERKEH